jgi:aspartokinase
MSGASVQQIQFAPQPRAVVHKFGGSSLANAAAVRQAAAIVAREAASPCYVVVSAAFGVTNDLLECLRLSVEEGDWQRQLVRVWRRQSRLLNTLVADKAGKLCAELRVDCRQIRKLLAAAEMLGIVSQETEDAVVGHGELWSMRLFAAVLEAQGLDGTALDARRFLYARRLKEHVDIDWLASSERFASEQATRSAEIVVVPGFVATCADRGITLTLGRNGSDWLLPDWPGLQRLPSGATYQVYWTPTRRWWATRQRKFDSASISPGRWPPAVPACCIRQHWNR